MSSTEKLAISLPKDLIEKLRRAKDEGRIDSVSGYIADLLRRQDDWRDARATLDRIFLIDPTRGLDISPLSDLLADPDIETVVHAGWQDLQLFYQRTGHVPANVFDVQLAAGFAGLSASLAYGKLVQELTGVELEKGEAYTDWCRRPLTDNQLRYAADDVRYLVAVRDQS